MGILDTTESGSRHIIELISLCGISCLTSRGMISTWSHIEHKLYQRFIRIRIEIRTDLPHIIFRR